MNKTEFKANIQSRKTAYGLFLSIQTDKGYFAFHYKNVSLTQARIDFIKVFYPLYKGKLNKEK